MGSHPEDAPPDDLDGGLPTHQAQGRTEEQMLQHLPAPQVSTGSEFDVNFKN